MTGAAAALQHAPETFHAKTDTTPGRRFFDNAAAAWMVKVFPGEFYVTRRADEVVLTVLGSCVSACIRDPILGIGGMNHFMLPSHSSGDWGGDLKSTRFGNFAMEKLINELLKAGCTRERMEIKVFGGANVTDSSNAVGSDNSEFVLRYLEAEGLRCTTRPDAWFADFWA
jgi:chemotaxis protein CheD